jgi:hypothetical protein
MIRFASTPLKMMPLIESTGLYHSLTHGKHPRLLYSTFCCARLEDESSLSGVSLLLLAICCSLSGVSYLLLPLFLALFFKFSTNSVSHLEPASWVSLTLDADLSGRCIDLSPRCKTRSITCWNLILIELSMLLFVYYVFYLCGRLSPLPASALIPLGRVSRLHYVFYLCGSLSPLPASVLIPRGCVSSLHYSGR